MVGTAVRLSATASLAATRGVRLRYRWVILRAPRGSRARLRDATGPRPVLRPDRPGLYVLQVTIFHGRSGAPIAGLGRVGGLCATPGTSSTIVALDSTVLPPSIGVPVDTIASQNSRLGVDVQGAQADSYQTDHFYPADPSKALQMVVLDRETLARISNQSYPNDASGATALLKAVQALPTGVSAPLVIITKPDPAVTAPGPVSPAAGAVINQALGVIGVTGVPATVSLGSSACGGQGQCSSFSAIGVPGLPAGQGQLNPGLSSPLTGGGSVHAGDLHGYFAPATDNDTFVFINRERVEFDTGDAKANPAIVTVGHEPGSDLPAQTFTSTKLSGAGFYVLVLDSGSLHKNADGTFTDDNSGLAGMHTLLSAWENNPSALVIIRSIGAVARVNSGTGRVGAWDAVAGDVQQLGGSLFYFDALNGDPGPNGSSQYAQVGPGGQARGYPSRWTQVASHEASVPGPLPTVNGAQVNPGRLTGLLGRNPSAQFYPDESVPLDKAGKPLPLAGTLPGLISTPTTAWPDRTGADGKAVACIAAHIFTDGPLPMPLESNYLKSTLRGKWDGWANQLANGEPSYQTLTSSPDNCTGFIAKDLATVENELAKEFAAVNPVWQMFDDLGDPYIAAAGSSSVVGSALAAIDDSLKPPSQAQASGINPASVVEDLLWIASGLVPGEGEISSVVTALLNTGSGGIALGLDLDVDTSGAAAAPPDLTIPAADLATRLQNIYNSAVAGLIAQRDILLSDPEKLITAGQNAVGTTNAVADWSWGATGATNAQVYTAATDRIRLAATRLAYQTLFPLGYSLYRLSAGTGTLNPQDVTSYKCEIYTYNMFDPLYPTDNIWYPFRHVPRYGGVAPTVSGEGTVEQWVYGTPDTSFLSPPGADGNFPKQTLVNGMFTASNGTPPLFNPLQFAVEAYHDANNYIPVTHVHTDQHGTTNQTCKAG